MERETARHGKGLQQSYTRHRLQRCTTVPWELQLINTPTGPTTTARPLFTLNLTQTHSHPGHQPHSSHTHHHTTCPGLHQANRHESHPPLEMASRGTLSIYCKLRNVMHGHHTNQLLLVSRSNTSCTPQRHLLRVCCVTCVCCQLRALIFGITCNLAPCERLRESRSS